MNRFLAITLLLILVNIFVSAAQESSKPLAFPKAVFGLKGGVNISRLSASVNSETRAKSGLVFGMYLKKQIGPRLYFSSEWCYSSQGQKDNYLYPYGGPSIGSTTTSLHCLNFPLLFELGNTISFQFGGQLGVLLSGSEKGTIASVAIDENMNEVLTTTDFAFVAGVGYSFNRNINCGVRLNYGVTNILKPEQGSNLNTDLPKVHNRVLQCYVAYSF